MAHTSLRRRWTRTLWVVLWAPCLAVQGGDLQQAIADQDPAAEGIDRMEKVAAQEASADAYLLAAQTRLGMNQFDLAQRDAEAARRLNSALPGLLTLDGMILEQTGDYDAAQTSLEKAILENPEDYDAHYSLGALFYFKRHLPQARLHLERAMVLQPSSLQVKYELALVARAQGRLDAARQYLETVAGASPEWLEPHVYLAALDYRLHRPTDGAREKKIVDHLMAEQQQSHAQRGR